jgi:uncharacterized membrane protein YjjP (DUF1212 family)
MLGDVGCALRNIFQRNASVQTGQEIGVDKGGFCGAQFMYLMGKIQACNGAFFAGIWIKA